MIPAPRARLLREHASSLDGARAVHLSMEREPFISRWSASLSGERWCAHQRPQYHRPMGTVRVALLSQLIVLGVASMGVIAAPTQPLPQVAQPAQATADAFPEGTGKAV